MWYCTHTEGIPELVYAVLNHNTTEKTLSISGSVSNLRTLTVYHVGETRFINEIISRQAFYMGISGLAKSGRLGVVAVPLRFINFHKY